jgi:hypothetical protein
MTTKILPLNWNDHRNLAGPDTCKAALLDAIERVEKDDFQKVLILFLDDRNGYWRAGFQNAGLKNSEMVALIETMKAQLIEDLRGINE